jgi:predicted translin family RNA/ssDNA-binding protein
LFLEADDEERDRMLEVARTLSRRSRKWKKTT